MRRTLPFYLFTLSLIIGILVPTLIRDGMFLDGVVYSAVSKNLAHGIGHWFAPQLNSSPAGKFFDHPPLGFIIQSLFFKVLGDGIFTERIYSFLMALLSASGIIFCLKSIGRQKFKNIYWFPVVLWILTPTISWAYKNNMLENTLSVFVIFAVGTAIKAVNENKFPYLILSAFLTFLAFLTKGFVGLFPVVVSGLYAVIFVRNRTIAKLKYIFAPALLTVFFLFMSFMLFPSLKENIIKYMNVQLFPALQNKREITTNNYYNIILILFKELIIPVTIVLILILTAKVAKVLKPGSIKDQNIILFFLIIGLSGSLPLMVTLKQRAFYLVPSIPFFILAFTIIIAHPIHMFIEKLSVKTISMLKIAGFISVFGSLIFSATFVNKFSRDEILLKDVHKICMLIPHDQTISLLSERDNFWKINAYLSRYGNIRIERNQLRLYLLIDKSGNTKTKIDSLYVPLHSDMSMYEIYRKNFISGAKNTPD